jgi:adenine phosphoribosyltransferase
MKIALLPLLICVFNVFHLYGTSESATKEQKLLKLKGAIREIADFPKPGINFQDITTLLQDPEAFSLAIDLFADHYREKQVEGILGLESRGFIFGAALAYELKVPFITIRKKGKLPFETVSASYEKEYGFDSMEMHVDALRPGQKVVIIDDLIATGGSLEAGVALARMVGADPIEGACVIELEKLGGREKVSVPLFTLLKY